jgi:uncharacterized YigZ family protein
MVKVSLEKPFFLLLILNQLPLTTDTYLTISQPTQGTFKEKGSKFLAFSYPVVNEKEVKAILEMLKKKYFDARHHCYAYRLGADKLTYRVNDDGEPSGTAGKPILGQITSKDLTNILIVVVRYFGGTLLGTGGLINAYRTASADALSNAFVVQKFVYAIYEIEYDYEHMNKVMKILKDFHIDIADQIFDSICRIKLKIKLSIIDSVLEKLATIEKLKINYILRE